MMEDQDKPVILVVDDINSCWEAKVRFAEKQQLIYTASSVREMYEVFHEKHAIGNVAVLIDPRNVHNMAFTSYINQALQHRAMLHVWTANADNMDMRDWANKTGSMVYSYFSKDTVLDSGIHIPGTPVEVIAHDVINSPAWKWIRGHFKDGLTGFDNAIGFFHVVKPQLEAMRDGRSDVYYASILVIDGNGVKSINDTYGHLPGTEAILIYANTLREFLRKSDHPCRYGGDEFLLWLPGRGKIPALKLGEKIQHKISTVDFFPREGERVALSVSVGIAEVDYRDIGEDVEADLKRFIDQADQEMYKEKELHQKLRQMRAE